MIFFLILFSNKMMVIHKMLVRRANRKDLSQSDLGLHCLSGSFWQATSVQNFRTFTEVVLFWGLLRRVLSLITPDL